MATIKERLEQSQKAIADYFKLSGYLFGPDAPLDIHDIPSDHFCHADAKAMADEMGLDWDKMPHEESNHVMLNLLMDYFCRIDPEEGYKPVLTISFTKAE